MPWHREGVVLEEYPESWADVASSPAWTGTRSPSRSTSAWRQPYGTPNSTRSRSGRAIYRLTPTTCCGSNQDSYELIDHDAMGEIVEAVLAQSNVKWETGGVLEEGRAVWVSGPARRTDRAARRPHGDLALHGDHQPPRQSRRLHPAFHRGSASSAAHPSGPPSSKATGPGPRSRSAHEEVARPDRGARQAVTGTRREIRAYVEMANELLGIRVDPQQRELLSWSSSPCRPRAWSPTGWSVTSRAPPGAARHSWRPRRPHRWRTRPTAWSRAREIPRPRAQGPELGNQAQPAR